MKIECISNELTERQRQELGIVGAIRQAITPGKVYVVLGISIMPNRSKNGTGVFFEIENDWGQCRSISSCLFKITDDRCSKYWKARAGERGGFCIWPEHFYQEYFHDDLEEGRQEVKNIFREIVDQLSNEF